MSRRATIEELERVCPHCRNIFLAGKPSQKRKFCGHHCAAMANRLGDEWKSEASAAGRALAADRKRGTGSKHPYVKRGGRHEHRVVMEEKLGRPLAPGEIVHHRDEDGHNNRPDNLEITDRASHARHHNTGTRRTPKTHCKAGHPLDEANTTLTSIGRRRCLTCQREYDRKWQRAKRASASKYQGDHRENN